MPFYETVSGKVTSQNGQPLGGVAVKVMEVGLTTTTTSEGLYKLQLPGGHYTVRYSYDGCQSRVLTIDLTGSFFTADVQLSCEVAAAPWFRQTVIKEKVLYIKPTVAPMHNSAADSPGVWVYIPADQVPLAIRQWKASHRD